jgi:hypothetical protein
MMVLQSSTHSPRILPASASEMYLTSSKDVCGAISVKVEEDTDINIKEEIPEPIFVSTVNVDEDQVSCLCPL